ncbi:MAG: cytochrome c [Chloroflexi bacterium]|nr:cytochrome c [Chloroflexota bacterium]
MRRLLALTLLTVALLAACSSKDTEFKYSDLPAGDAANGASLFTQSINGSSACSNCHTIDGTDTVAPSLGGFATVAGSRVGGQSADVYAFYSLLRPSKHLVSGFSNIMPSDYEDKLSKQDIADLIAYMLSLGDSAASTTGTPVAAAQSSGGGGKDIDTFMLVFRLIHIFAGALWFGSGVFMILFLEPTFQSTGRDGLKVMRAFFKTTRFTLVMPVAAITTTIAGLGLYYRVSDHFNADWMSSSSGTVLSIGVMAGLAAFVHGASVIGPTTGKLTKMSDALGSQTEPTTDEQMAALSRLQSSSRLHGWASIVLIIIAMTCMISARYL